MSGHRFRVIFYRTAAGRCQACDYARAMNPRHRKKSGQWFVELADLGPSAPKDHAKYLRDGVWELRIIIERHQHRFLFAYWKDIVVVTNAFLKKTAAVPDQEIETARRSMTDWIRNRGWESL